MKNGPSITRRTWMSLLSAPALSAAISWPESFRQRTARYLETHRRPEGGYGWTSDVVAHISPTFGVIGSYHLLDLDVPDADRAAAFARDIYPVPELRRKDRPLWRLDFEQVQTLLWLGRPIDGFRPLASTWTRPAEFTTRYELGGNPVFQHQAMAVHVRHLLGLSPAESDDAWREYFQARRRGNGTFNTTPAADGSDGHVMNTAWGLQAADCLGVALPAAPQLAGWVNACQLPSGGFTYAPGASIGGVDDIAYTWCALRILERLGAKPAQAAACAAWIESLHTAEGGFQDRPGGEPNPLATFYALDSLRLLNHAPRSNARPASRAKRHAIPSGFDVFSIQVEAPGAGSPREAVLLAQTLGIHLWTAKNSGPGWIDEAQRLAGEARVPVRFAIGNEEYGTYFGVPGLGCYSHLVDFVAPYDAAAAKAASAPRRTDGRPDFITPPGAMEKMNFAYTWDQFRDRRIVQLRKAQGRMVWQFLENEELTRVLLDDGVANGSYSAIASFHFGNENFLHSQSYLHRWYGRLPFVGLQDAHGQESWWWGNQLAGFTTLFAGRDGSWESWLEALDRNLVMSVRHDAITGWKTHYAGGSPELRAFVQRREARWRWWDESGAQSRRPAAALVLLRPGMRFEAGVPAEGAALRLRLWQENTGQALPREPRAELVRLSIDGHAVEPKLVETRNDRYFLCPAADTPGAHRAEAGIRLLASGRITTVTTTWSGGRATP